MRVASARTLAIRTFGGHVLVDVGGSHADRTAEAVRDAWAWCLDPDDFDHRQQSLSSRLEAVLDDDPSVVAAALERGAVAASDLDTVLHLLTQAITVAGIDLQAGRLLMLHAAAVADRESGCALAVVAPAGGGKTTFVRSLGEDRVYVTDETVALTGDHLIVPYPKPLSIHTPGLNLKRQIDPRRFHFLQPGGPYELGALWTLNRTAYPTPARLERIPTLEGVTTLASQTSYLAMLPRPLHRLAATIAAAGGMYRAVYHEANDLRELVAQAIDPNPSASQAGT